MIAGARLRLQPIRDDDWRLIEAWAGDRDALWGHSSDFKQAESHVEDSHHHVPPVQ
jgi:hypothetical protein